MLLELRFDHKNFEADLNQLLDRSVETDVEVENTVREIIKTIKVSGDSGLIEYTLRFDRVSVTSAHELEMTSETITAQLDLVDNELYAALEAAANRIEAFHRKEIPKSWQYTEADGSTLGQWISPMERVGVYVPGGKAAYPSSVLMTTIPAKVAGVKEIIMTVPTPNGEISSAVVAAAKISGVDRIFTVGGAQAIAALAYGTQTIPKVDKIVGPGNSYVATAKKFVFGDVGIDMIAGPSEVVVICDNTADPDWVAMDLFAQAEHDELAQSIAITDSLDMVEKIQQSIKKLLPEMSRKDIIEKSLLSQGAIIWVNSLSQAVAVSNRIAPEHLELMVEEDEKLLDLVQHAGAIFIGKYSAEVLGDYCAGPNHVLPTAGTARFSSPLGVYDFLKRSSLVRASSAGASEMAKVASRIAHSEGLTAHERSAKFRMKNN